MIGKTSSVHLLNWTNDGSQRGQREPRGPALAKVSRSSPKTTKIINVEQYALN